MDIIPRTKVAITTDLAILGGILVSSGLPFWANVIWTISNPFLVYHNHINNQPEQRNLFIVMTIVSTYGIINLWPL